MSIYLHPFAATIWAISTLVMYALAWVIWFCPGQRRHDLFAYYCTYSALASTTLFICSALNDGVAYTFVYACSMPTKLALGLLALSHCIWNSLRHHMKARKWELLLDLTPFLVAAVALGLRFKPTATDLWNGAEVVFVLLSGSTLWVISFASDSWKARWATREYGIALGFLWLYSIRFVIVGLRVVIPPAGIPSTYCVDVCTTLGAIILWLRFFLKTEPNLRVPSYQQLTQVADFLYSCQQSTRKQYVDSTHLQARN